MSGSPLAPQAPLDGFVLEIPIRAPHQRVSLLVLLLNFHSLKLISSDEMDELPSGTWGLRPLPDCGLDKWVRFGRWKGILALMWFYSRTLWIYIPANSIMVSSKKNNDLHVTDRNWKSLSSSSSLKPLSFAPNHQAFLKLCALDDFQQRSRSFIFRLWLGQLLFCDDGCKIGATPTGFLCASSSGPISFESGSHISKALGWWMDTPVLSCLASVFSLQPVETQSLQPFHLTGSLSFSSPLQLSC